MQLTCSEGIFHLTAEVVLFYGTDGSFFFFLKQGHRERKLDNAADNDGRGETIQPSLTLLFPTFLPSVATGFSCCCHSSQLEPHPASDDHKAVLQPIVVQTLNNSL